MERLGIYIFVFFFLGLTFFERVRTRGYTGSLWTVLSRNFAVVLFSMLAFAFWGTDIMAPGFERNLFGNALEIINYVAPYGETDPGHRMSLFIDFWMQSLFAATACLIVAAGIWELRFHRWNTLIHIAVFTLVVYPIFGFMQSEKGVLGAAGFYDFNGALLVWALPAAYVLGVRLATPVDFLPGLKQHNLKGVKILPGMKHRFFLARGIGLTTVFLVLNATTLDGHKWFVSKTLTLIPSSLMVLLSQSLFFLLFGKKDKDRVSFAPPILAIMAAVVGTQACEKYLVWQVVLASVITTLLVLVYLRKAPLIVRTWDPICSLPVFLLGGSAGVLFASLTPVAEFGQQLLGVLTCLVFGGGTGALLTFILTRFRRPKPALITTTSGE